VERNKHTLDDVVVSVIVPEFVAVTPVFVAVEVVVVMVVIVLVLFDTDMVTVLVAVEVWVCLLQRLTEVDHAVWKGPGFSLPMTV
jgi:hypothetical protein